MQCHGLPLHHPPGVQLGEARQVIVVHQSAGAAPCLHQQPPHAAALLGRLLPRQPPHHLGCALRAVLNQHRLGDLWHVEGAGDVERGGVLLQRLLQPPHLSRLAVHQHHVRRLQLIQELAGLREVGVG